MQIGGFFLSFKDEEKQAINDGLAALDYTPDDEGLKLYILDSLTGEDLEREEPGAVDRLADLLRKNPETVGMVGGIAKYALGNLAARVAAAAAKARR